MFPKLLLIALLSIFFSSAAAEQIAPVDGGGIAHMDFRDHVSAEQRAAIILRLEANRASLIRQGVLPIARTFSAAALAHPLFDWPTTSSNGDPGHFGISNFVDHDAAFPNSLEDYQCGTRTYDIDSGYNHKGIDVFSWPFPWLKMDNDEVQILAAAAGVILDKDDGNFDRNCSFTGSWNAVYIEHADGSVAWYGHLKKNSLTNKSIGQSIQAGEYLGIMGSSGRSTGPHLHFEVYDADNKLIDPSSGSCNSLNTDSWWNSQRPYYEPGINLVATHDAPPLMNNGCGVTETPNLQTRFEPGQKAYFALYLRDQQAGQRIDMKIIQPDGQVWREWSHSMDSPDHYASSWWYWSRTLPGDAQAGVWKWNVQFQGQEPESGFTVSSTVFMDGFEE